MHQPYEEGAIIRLTFPTLCPYHMSKLQRLTQSFTARDEYSMHKVLGKAEEYEGSYNGSGGHIHA